MNEKNIEQMRKMSREELEKLTISLWDDLYEGLFEPKGKQERYIKHLESENERLNKAVHNIYQEIKMKSLRFMVDAKPNEATRDIFIECFKKYLS